VTRVLLLLVLVVVVLRLARASLARSSASGAGGGWDPWAVLGVPRDASREQIARAYRDQVKRYHPDRVADLGPELQQVAHRKTVELQRAYAELTR
jgi:preprotein translocase subunit Sec63